MIQRRPRSDLCKLTVLFHHQRSPLQAHSFSYSKTFFCTHAFRQLSWGFPIFHCTQILGQRPFLIPVQRPTPAPLFLQTFQTTSRTSNRSFTSLLADADNPPPVQVSSISDEEGIRFVDGLVLSAASRMFLHSKRVEGTRPKRPMESGDGKSFRAL